MVLEAILMWIINNLVLWTLLKSYQWQRSSCLWPRHQCKATFHLWPRTSCRFWWQSALAAPHTTAHSSPWNVWGRWWGKQPIAPDHGKWSNPLAQSGRSLHQVISASLLPPWGNLWFWYLYLYLCVCMCVCVWVRSCVYVHWGVFFTSGW